jgi:hypothetical protein
MRISHFATCGLLLTAAILVCNNPVIAAEPLANSPIVAPANAPAEVLWESADGSLKLRYHDTVILGGKILVQTGADKRPAKRDEVVLKQSTTAGDKIEQVLHLSPAQANAADILVFQGVINGSEESFAAETLSEAQKRFPLVCMSVGQSHNLRNNGIWRTDAAWAAMALGRPRCNATIPGTAWSGAMTPTTATSCPLGMLWKRATF